MERSCKNPGKWKPVKSIALFTLAAFLSTQVVIPAPVSSAQTSEPVAQVGNAGFTIPPELGKIDEVYFAPEGGGRRAEGDSPGFTSSAIRHPISGRKTIVFLQDAHDSLEAQENIAKIIDHLVKEKGVRTVFEEGYEGPVPTDKFFGSIQDPAVKQKVSYFLLDKLRIGGAEYAHINRKLADSVEGIENRKNKNSKKLNAPGSTLGGDWNLIGVDDLKLYSENIGAYQRAAANRQETEEDLRELFSQITTLAHQYFPQPLKTWLKVKERYSERKLSLLDYLRELRKIYLGISPRGFLDNLKGSMSFPHVSSGNPGSGLNSGSPMNTFGDDNPKRDSDTVVRFENEYPATSLLLSAGSSKDKKLIGQLNALDSKVVFSEMMRLEKDVSGAFLKNDRDQRIFTYCQGLDLLRRLNRIEVTQDEYEALLAYSAEGIENRKSKVSGELNAPRSTLNADLQPSALFNTQGMVDFIVSLTGKSLALSKSWEQRIQDAVRFYDIARSRDRSLAKALGQHFSGQTADPRLQASDPLFQGKSLQSSKSLQSDTAILVYGGFHANAIKELLKEQGVSYVVISPRITSISKKHQDYYKQLMSVGHHSFEAPFLVTRANKPPSVYFAATVNGPAPVERQIQAIRSAVVTMGDHSDTALIQRRLGSMNFGKSMRSEVRERLDGIKSSIRDGWARLDGSNRGRNDPGIAKAIQALHEYRLADALALLAHYKTDSDQKRHALKRLTDDFPPEVYSAASGWNGPTVDLEEQTALFRGIEHALNVLSSWGREAVASDSQVLADLPTPFFWAGDPHYFQKKKLFGEGMGHLQKTLAEVFPGARLGVAPAWSDKFKAMLPIILHGNRTDDLSRVQEAEHIEDHYLVDHRSVLMKLVNDPNKKHIAIALDNLGGETFSLLLAAWILIQMGKTVTVFGKKEPMLFSDTTLPDLKYSVNVFDRILSGYFSGSPVPSLANALKSGALLLREVPYDYTYRGERAEGRKIVSLSFDHLGGFDAAMIIGELQYGDFMRQQLRRVYGTAYEAESRSAVGLNPFTRTELVFLKANKNTRETNVGVESSKYRSTAPTQGEFVVQVLSPFLATVQRSEQRTDEKDPLRILRKPEGRRLAEVWIDLYPNDGNAANLPAIRQIVGHLASLSQWNKEMAEEIFRKFPLLQTMHQNFKAATQDMALSHPGVQARMKLFQPYYTRGNFLDVGTGNNRLPRLVRRENPQLDYVLGVDVEDQRAAKDKGPDPFIRMTDPKEIPVPDSFADMANFTYVLHHVEVDREKYLQEVWRVLPPGARVFVLEDTFSRELPVQYFDETSVGESAEVQRMFDALESDEDRLAFLHFVDAFNHFFVNRSREPLVAGHYESMESWEKIFRGAGFEILEKKYLGFSRLGSRNPVARGMFVLQKPAKIHWADYAWTGHRIPTDLLTLGRFAAFDLKADKQLAAHIVLWTVMAGFSGLILAIGGLNLGTLALASLNLWGLFKILQGETNRYLSRARHHNTWRQSTWVDLLNSKAHGPSDPGPSARSEVRLHKLEAQLEVLASPSHALLSRGQVAEILGLVRSGGLKLFGEDLDVVQMVDGKEKVVGAVDLMVVHLYGLLHRSVDVFVRMPNNKYLILRRPPGRIVPPNADLNKFNAPKFSIPGGHPSSGETYREGIEKELIEEIGLPEGWTLEGELQAIGVEGEFMSPPEDLKNRERRAVYLYNPTPREAELVWERNAELTRAKQARSKETYKKWLHAQQIAHPGRGEAWSYHEFSLDEIREILSGKEVIQEDNYGSGDEMGESARVVFAEDLLPVLLKDERILASLRSKVRIGPEERKVLEEKGQRIFDYLAAQEEYVPGQPPERAWVPASHKTFPWDPSKKHLVMVLGSWDERTATQAAHVIKEIRAQGGEAKVLTSGKYGNKPGIFYDDRGQRLPEAIGFKQIIEKEGVPVDFTEIHSTDSGKNILFSKALLDEASYNPDVILLMQTPILQRRSGLTLVRQYLGSQAAFDASEIRLISYAAYIPKASAQKDSDLLRDIGFAIEEITNLRDYPKRGFTVPTGIPEEVSKAAEVLKALIEEIKKRSVLQGGTLERRTFDEKEIDLEIFDPEDVDIELEISPDVFNAFGMSRLVFDRVKNQIFLEDQPIGFNEVAGKANFLRTADMKGKYEGNHQGREAFALPGGNLGQNNFYVGIVDGRVYYYANDPLTARPMLVVKKSSKEGKQEKPVVMLLSFKKEAGGTLRAIDPSGNDITDEIQIALYGMPVIREGRLNLKETLEQLDDLRHLFRFPAFNIVEADTARKEWVDFVHLGMSDGVGIIYKDPARRAQLLSGQPVTLSVEPLLARGVTPEEIKAVYEAWRYREKKTGQIKKGQYRYNEKEKTLTAIYESGTHPHSYFGITRNGKLFIGALQGELDTHFKGISLKGLYEKLKERPEFVKDPVQYLWIWQNGKDVSFRSQGSATKGVRHHNVESLIFSKPVPAQSAAAARSEMRDQIKREIRVSLQSLDAFVETLGRLHRDLAAEGKGPGILSKLLFEATKNNPGWRQRVSDYYDALQKGSTRSVEGSNEELALKVIKNLGIGPILMISPEVAPFSMAGGMAKVLEGLPQALVKTGAEVHIVTFLFDQAQGTKHKSAEELLRDGILVGGEKVPIEDTGKTIHLRFGSTKNVFSGQIESPVQSVVAKVYRARSQGVTIDLLYAPELTDKLYPTVSSSGQLKRAIFLSRGSLEVMRQFDLRPDFILANDWMAAPAFAYLKADPIPGDLDYRQDEHFYDPETGLVPKLGYIVHNLGRDYQARFFTIENSIDLWPLFRLQGEHYGGLSNREGELPAYSTRLNLARGGIVHSHFALTVSPSYAREIQTPEKGEGVHQDFLDKEKVYGISNGIDLPELRREFVQLGGGDPQKPNEGDFARKLPSYKAFALQKVQEKYGLNVRPDAVLVSMVGRLADQKGVELVAASAKEILDRDPRVQLLIAGSIPVGDPSAYALRDAILELQEDPQYQGRVGKEFEFVAYRNALEIYLASSLFLMPSKYEPGGLTYIEGLAAGAATVAHKVGGMNDNLTEFDADRGTGDAFFFREFTAEAFLEAASRGITALLDPKQREMIVAQAAAATHDWSDRVPAYLAMLRNEAGVFAYDYPHLRQEQALLEKVIARSPEATTPQRSEIREQPEKAQHSVNMWKVLDPKTGAERGVVYQAPFLPKEIRDQATAWRDFNEMVFEFPKLLERAARKKQPVVLVIPEQLEGFGPLANEAPWIEGARTALAWASSYFRFKELGNVDVRVLQLPAGDVPQATIAMAVKRLLSKKILDTGPTPELQMESRIFRLADALTIVSPRKLEFSLAPQAIGLIAGEETKKVAPEVIHPNLPPVAPGKKRIVITGAAGFIGINLVKRLLAEGHQVIALDSGISANEAFASLFRSQPNLYFKKMDVSEPLDVEGPVDQVIHLASLASPPDYYGRPLETLRSGLQATREMLELSRRKHARFLFTSTSEVYGDAQVHPQAESYEGNVDPFKKRSQYDQSKRGAETLIKLYNERYTHEDPDYRIARLFNTYGPFMRLHDGRVITNFIGKVFANQPIEIYGSESITRSFGYVDDTVDGLMKLLRTDKLTPATPIQDRVFNVGNDSEFTLRELADLVNDLGQRYLDRTVPVHVVELKDPSDPKQRKPDLTRARTVLGYAPSVPLWQGLEQTFIHFLKDRTSLHNRSEMRADVSNENTRHVRVVEREVKGSWTLPGVEVSQERFDRVAVAFDEYHSVLRVNINGKDYAVGHGEYLKLTLPSGKVIYWGGQHNLSYSFFFKHFDKKAEQRLGSILWRHADQHLDRNSMSFVSEHFSRTAAPERQIEYGVQALDAANYLGFIIDRSLARVEHASTIEELTAWNLAPKEGGVLDIDLDILIHSKTGKLQDSSALVEKLAKVATESEVVFITNSSELQATYLRSGAQIPGGPLYLDPDTAIAFGIGLLKEIARQDVQRSVPALNNRSEMRAGIEKVLVVVPDDPWRQEVVHLVEGWFQTKQRNGQVVEVKTFDDAWARFEGAVGAQEPFDLIVGAISNDGSLAFKFRDKTRALKETPILGLSKTLESSVFSKIHLKYTKEVPRIFAEAMNALDAEKRFIPHSITASDGAHFEVDPDLWVTPADDDYTQGSGDPDSVTISIRKDHVGAYVDFTKAGYMSISNDTRGSFNPVAAIKVADEWRKRYSGIGRSLMSLAFQVARATTGTSRFYVRESLADEFYASLGMMAVQDPSEKKKNFWFPLEPEKMFWYGVELPPVGIKRKLTRDLLDKLPEEYQSAYGIVSKRSWFGDPGAVLSPEEAEIQKAKRVLLEDNALEVLKMSPPEVPARLRAINVLVPYQAAVERVKSRLLQHRLLNKVLTPEEFNELLARRSQLKEHQAEIFRSVYQGEMDGLGLQKVLTELEAELPKRAEELARLRDKANPGFGAIFRAAAELNPGFDRTLLHKAYLQSWDMKDPEHVTVPERGREFYFSKWEYSVPEDLKKMGISGAQIVEGDLPGEKPAGTDEFSLVVGSSSSEVAHLFVPSRYTAFINLYLRQKTLVMAAMTGRQGSAESLAGGDEQIRSEVRSLPSQVSELRSGEKRSEIRRAQATIQTETAKVRGDGAETMIRAIRKNAQPATVFVDAEDFANLSSAQKKEYLLVSLSNKSTHFVVYNEQGQDLGKEFSALLKAEHVTRTGESLGRVLEIFQKPNVPAVHLSKQILPDPRTVRSLGKRVMFFKQHGEKGGTLAVALLWAISGAENARLAGVSLEKDGFWTVAETLLSDIQRAYASSFVVAIAA